jgi:hypothetical protein
LSEILNFDQLFVKEGAERLDSADEKGEFQAELQPAELMPVVLKVHEDAQQEQEVDETVPLQPTTQRRIVTNGRPFGLELVKFNRFFREKNLILIYYFY